MKLELRTRWLRLLIELLPSPLAIRRYRVLPQPLDAHMQRLLRARISRRFLRATREAA